MMRLAVLGGGAMGEALVRGVLAAGWDPREIVVAELVDERRRHLAETLGIDAVATSGAAAAQAPTVVLAVKPQDVHTALDDAAGSFGSHRLLISIAAAVSIATLESRLGSDVPVVRVMPNLPAQLGAGISAVAAGAHATEEHVRTAEEILGAVGEVVRVPESLMHAVTALSGSGPAYVFLLAEMLADAGAALGLPPDVARQLTVQTVLGAARMLVETGRSATELRAMVTSKGGTTEAALAVLEDAALRDAFRAALAAAAERSRQLGSG